MTSPRACAPSCRPRGFWSWRRLCPTAGRCAFAMKISRQRESVILPGRTPSSSAACMFSAARSRKSATGPIASARRSRSAAPRFPPVPNFIHRSIFFISAKWATPPTPSSPIWQRIARPRRGKFASKPKNGGRLRTCPFQLMNSSVSTAISSARSRFPAAALIPANFATFLAFTGACRGSNRRSASSPNSTSCAPAVSIPRPISSMTI